jgi:hypothetical protein
MSESVDPTTPEVQQAAATEAGATKKGTSPEGEYTADSKISTMADVKEIAPKVYDSMMNGIATTIIKRMRSHQANLKKKWREMSK